ncbi:MAG TPA: hypothetical protein DCQ31_08890, partial [Bacteroidales bacterium]|nr:hypothetical protein [Bacteroidales bacterium]
MKKYIILSFISLFISFSSLVLAQAPGGMQGGARNSMPYSQRPAVGTITGIIVDSQSGEPMEFATVTLRVLPNDSIVSGGLTDKKGRFSIEKVRIGMHKLEVSFIGYNVQMVEKLMIKPDAPIVDAGTLKLKPSDSMIQEISVTGEKSFVRNTVDKKIYSVEKLNASEGSSVNEALANIPAVNVDGDGNVSLRGSTNVKFLINGKPSAMLNDGSSILDQIPANSIQSVEIITNPSAKYDPDGMTGIINIVMKEDKEKGFNGSVSANYGFFDKYNGSLNLNYKVGKLNTFVSGSYMQRSNKMDGYNLRTDTRDVVNKFMEQETEGLMGMKSYMLRYGFDYAFNAKNSVSFSGSNGLWSHSRNEDLEYKNLDNLKNQLSNSYRSSESSYGRNPFDLNLSYEHKFSNPSEKMTVDMMYSGS